MPVKVTDATFIVKNTIVVASSAGLRQICEEIVQLSTATTPKKIGELRRSVLKRVLGLQAQISWNKEYAAAQEDTQYRNYTTPGTGPHFAETAVRAVVARSGEIFAKRQA